MKTIDEWVETALVGLIFPDRELIEQLRRNIKVAIESAIDERQLLDVLPGSVVMTEVPHEEEIDLRIDGLIHRLAKHVRLGERYGYRIDEDAWREVLRRGFVVHVAVPPAETFPG